MQGRSQLDIERLKFEANLVLKAIEIDDSEKAKKNLLFMLRAGLIQDKEGKITALAVTPGDIPVLRRSRPRPAITCAPGTSSVLIDSNPSPASVWSDGFSIAHTPWIFCAAVGQEVKFTLSYPGYLDNQVEFRVAEDSDHNILMFTMDPARGH